MRSVTGHHPSLAARWGLLYLLAPAAYTAVLVASVSGALPRLAAPVAYFLVGLVTVAVLLRILARRGVRLDRIGLTRRPPLGAVGLGFAGFLVGVAIFPLTEAAASALGLPMFWAGFGGEPTGPPWPPSVLLFVLLGPVLAAPVVEEVWFRGYLLGMLRERGVHAAVAVVASSILFGLFHLYGGPGFALFATFWSVVPAVLYLWTRTLWASLIVHLLNNAFAYLVVPALFMG